MSKEFDELKILLAKSGIKIKEANKGKFTEYCGGKVTGECIAKGKKSSDPKIRKRATFAANARKWKHLLGGSLMLQNGGLLFPNIKYETIETKNNYKPSSINFNDYEEVIYESPKQTMR